MQSKSKEGGVGEGVENEERDENRVPHSSLYSSIWMFHSGFTASRLQPFLSLFQRKDGESFLHLTSPLQVYVSHATNSSRPGRKESDRGGSVDRMREEQETAGRRRKKRFENSPEKSPERTKFGRSDYLQINGPRKKKKSRQKKGEFFFFFAVRSRRIKNIYQSYP